MWFVTNFSDKAMTGQPPVLLLSTQQRPLRKLKAQSWAPALPDPARGASNLRSSIIQLINTVAAP